MILYKVEWPVSLCFPSQSYGLREKSWISIDIYKYGSSLSSMLFLQGLVIKKKKRGKYNGIMTCKHILLKGYNCNVEVLVS